MITVYENVPMTVNVPAGSSLSVDTTGALLIEAVSGLGVSGTIASGVYGAHEYGPWASAGVVRLTATKRNASAEVGPSTENANFAKVNGEITSLVDQAGNVVVIGGGARPLMYSVASQVASGSVFADLTLATFSGTNGSGSVGGALGAYGTQPIDLVVNSGSASNEAIATVSGSWGFLEDGGPFVVVAEIVSGFTTNDTLKLALSSDAFATKSVTMTYTHHANRVGEPMIFFCGYPDSNTFVGAGGDVTSTATFNALRVTATSAGGTVGGTMRIHGVFKWRRNRPTVTVQFDDCWLSQYTSAFQYMANRGLVGDIGVIRERVGTAGYCSLTQLREMYAAGWGMVVHGNLPHSDASFTTQASITADTVATRDYILGNLGDRGAYHFIYPGGIVNTTLDSKAALRAAGMRSARLVVSQINGRFDGRVDAPYSLYGRDLSSAFSAASDLTLLDRAIAAGSSVIFYGHKLVRASASGIEMNFSEFATFIDGISDRVRDGKVDVVTQSKLIDGR